jgi:hypothetical protein
MNINSKFSIELNGVLLNNDEYGGTSDTKVTIRQKDKQGLIFSFGTGLQFYKRGYDIIKQNIILSSSPYTSSIPIIIRDRCCSGNNGDDLIIFEGLISSSDIKYCSVSEDGVCFVEAEFKDNSEEAQKITCLKNTRIVDTVARDGSGRTSVGEDEGRGAVFYPYCIESRPSSSMFFKVWLVFTLQTAIIPVLIPVIALVALFNPNGAKDLLNRTLVEFPKRSIGCGRRHKAPFVFSYLQNVCKLCGLNLRSSLFDQGGKYHDLTHLNIPLSKGGKNNGEANQIFKELNFPNQTLPQFLQTFELLNIDYQVLGNDLVVERKDYFDGGIWLDFTQPTNQSKIISLCFNFGDVAPPAIGIYEFTEDTGDIGESVNRLWAGDVVDYNTPINPLLSGVEQKIIPFAPTRFLFDGQPSILRELRFFAGGKNVVEDDIMLLSRGMANIPKLLMYDTSTPFDEARVKSSAANSAGNKIYNVEAWIRQGAGSNVFPPTTGFYEELLTIDNPNNQSIRREDFELVFSYDCNDLRTFEFGELVKFERFGVVKEGSVESLDIDYIKRQITITGKC